MKLIHMLFLLLISCSLKHPVENPKDDFDKIIEIMKTKSISVLKKYYGEPDEIKVPEQDSNFRILIYKKSRIDAYVKIPNEEKISHLTLFFFEDFDNCRISNMGTRRFPERGPARTTAGQLMCA